MAGTCTTTIHFRVLIWNPIYCFRIFSKDFWPFVHFCLCFFLVLFFLFSFSFFCESTYYEKQENNNNNNKKKNKNNNNNNNNNNKKQKNKTKQKKKKKKKKQTKKQQHRNDNNLRTGRTNTLLCRRFYRLSREKRVKPMCCLKIYSKVYLMY